MKGIRDFDSYEKDVRGADTQVKSLNEVFGKNYEPKYDFVQPRKDRGTLRFSPTDTMFSRR